MIIKCKCAYCEKTVKIAVDDPGFLDPQPENRGFFQNFYNGTVWDSCYKEKKDRGEEIKQYFEKYKKNYPAKKNIPSELEDDIGTSTVVSGSLKKTYLYYKCSHCQETFFKGISKKERQKYAGGNPDPNATDVNHLNNQDQFGTQAVDNVSNSPYKNMDDFNRGNSSIKDKTNRKNKIIKWKK